MVRSWVRVRISIKYVSTNKISGFFFPENGNRLMTSTATTGFDRLTLKKEKFHWRFQGSREGSNAKGDRHVREGNNAQA